MYSNIEAQVALAKCKEGKKIYGVRLEKTSLGWKYNWAFPINEKRAKAENYDNTMISGNIYPTDDYPGCPYCGAKHFIVCGKCRRLNCNNESKTFTCEWCGMKGEIVSYTGGGISTRLDA